ncbi:MAG TPA: hypothetical protein V6C57_08405 [Coleofasciculaceae cyanobacterium]
MKHGDRRSAMKKTPLKIIVLSSIVDRCSQIAHLRSGIPDCPPPIASAVVPDRG